MRPLFSIIVPAYNASDYIKKCIKSILNQTCEDYELIIIDDGSKDNTLELCEKFKEESSKIKIIHQNNEGVVFARAKGVKKSEGEYLIFCDSDDMMHEEALHLIKDVIDNKNPDMITFKMSSDLKKLKKVKTGKYYDKEEIEKHIFPYLLEDKNGRYFKPSLWGGAYKRNLYINNQVDNEKIEIGEDLACVKSVLFNANSLYEMNDILYYYNNNPKSATRSKKIFLWNGPELIGKHIESKIDINKFDMKQQLSRVITHQLFLVAKSHFYEDKPYSLIKREIIEQLNNNYYINAVNECKYSLKNIKGSLAKIALKRKYIFLIYIFSIIN